MTGFFKLYTEPRPGDTVLVDGRYQAEVESYDPEADEAVVLMYPDFEPQEVIGNRIEVL